MKMDKRDLLDKAIEITKEHARSGANFSVETMLENVYKKLIELNKELE